MTAFASRSAPIERRLIWPTPRSSDSEKNALPAAPRQSLCFFRNNRRNDDRTHAPSSHYRRIAAKVSFPVASRRLPSSPAKAIFANELLTSIRSSQSLGGRARITEPFTSWATGRQVRRTCDCKSNGYPRFAGPVQRAPAFAPRRPHSGRETKLRHDFVLPLSSVKS